MWDDKDHKCDDQHADRFTAGTLTEGKAGQGRERDDTRQDTEHHTRNAVQKDADPLDQNDRQEQWQRNALENELNNHDKTSV